MEKPSAKQKAEFQTKRMAKELSLSEKQYKKVLSLNLKEQRLRESLMEDSGMSGGGPGMGGPGGGPGMGRSGGGPGMGGPGGGPGMGRSGDAGAEGQSMNRPPRRPQDSEMEESAEMKKF